MIEKIIDGIYKNNVESVLKRIPEEYKENVIIGYKEYLTKKYSDRVYEDKITEDDIKLFTDILSGQEKIDLNYAEDNELFSNVIKDINMDRFTYLYNIAFNYYNLKVSNLESVGLTTEIANNIILELESLKDKIFNFNQPVINKKIKEVEFYLDYCLGKVNKKGKKI